MKKLNITVLQTPAAETRTPLLALQVFERDRQAEGVLAQVDQRLGGLAGRVLGTGDFQGRRDETLVLYPSDTTTGPERVLLLGAGKREDYTAEILRRGVGVAVRAAEQLGVPELAMDFEHLDRTSERLGAYRVARMATEGAVLAAWNFREYKTQAEPDRGPRGEIRGFHLIARGQEEASEFERGAYYGEIVARAENLARELQSRPGNVATPSHLAKIAQQMGEEHGLRVTVLDRADMAEAGMHALLAVAQGSAEEPRFIAIEHRGGSADAPPLVLIGKGVTFDTGGISIKPADRMEDMKYDMSGAAAVLGAMQAIGELGLRVNVVGLVPSAENMPSGTALKPGDIISSHLGKTIEIINTDAEGRLLLADALSYARRYNPRAMVDAATLTGACVIALGNHAIGLMGNDGTLIDEVRAAGQRVGERCWPLPLWDEYREQISSDFADIKNSGGRAAGTITAAWFLKEFAGEIPWVHLDIAGTAYRDTAAPYLRKGATGVPTRLFVEWVQAHVEG